METYRKHKLPKRKNYLFLVGIGNYSSSDFPDLSNPVEDCELLKKVLLERYDFELVSDALYNKDASRENIINGLNALQSILTNEDNLIIYFAGHGEMNPATRKGFWVPYDANRQVSDFIPNSTIKDFIEGIEAKHIFLCSDACFSGTFLTQTRSALEEAHYFKIDSLRSRWALTSGGEHKVSDGKKEKNSPFAKYLIHVLEENKNIYISALEIINYVTKITGANSNQQPMGTHIENVGHEGGNMVLQLLDEYVENEINISNNSLNTDSLTRSLNEIEFRGGELATGKEILLIRSFYEKADYIIAENFRFNDEGQIKLKFSEDKVLFESDDGKSNEHWEVIKRFATWHGLEKWLDKNKDYYEDKKVIIIRAKSEIEFAEDSSAAIKHRINLVKILEESYDMHCLHCGEVISTNDSYLVEIEELNLQQNIGSVHEECLRPVDRILGQNRYENLSDDNLLINFDFNFWVSSIETGQGMINSTKRMETGDKFPMILWNPDSKFNLGNWCIEAILENGKSRMLHKGRQIERFTQEDIDKEVQFFQENLNKAIDENNYLCYTSKSNFFGRYNDLIKTIDDDEVLIKVVSFVKKRYSQLHETTSRLIINEFTPICYLSEKVSGQIIACASLVPLISDPLKLNQLLKNWQDVGFEVPNFKVSIIRDDAEFAQYMFKIFSSRMQPIVDPIFDLNKDLVSGIFIVNQIEYMADIINKSESDNMGLQLCADPKWLKGEKVYVEVPEIKLGKILSGILLEDEMIDDENIRRVILKVIEGEVEKDDLIYAIPSKLLRRE